MRSEHRWVRHQRRNEVLPRIVKGRGVRLIGEDGRSYIDGSSGPVLSCLGHCHPEVIDAITHQYRQLEFAFSETFATEPIDALADFITAETGDGLDRITFVSGGSEAVETCLRIAIQYHVAKGNPGCTRFISRRQSWHGYTLGALSVSGHYERRRYYSRLLDDTVFLSPANAYRPPPGVTEQDVGDYCARELEQKINKAGAENVAGFIFEPVVGTAGGAVPAPPDYATKVREICDRYEVLLIADEVMCGVGRCGAWRALEIDGVVPDLMAVAKGLAGGYIPIGASIYSDKIYNAITDAHGTVRTAHTYGGHAVACAGALAIQKIIKRDKLIDKVGRDGDRLKALLENTLGDRPYIGDIRGRGLLLGVEFVTDRDSKQPFPKEIQLASRLRKQTLDNGLICLPSSGTIDGINGDHVIVAPPYIVTNNELDEIVEKLVLSIDQVMSDVAIHQENQHKPNAVGYPN